MWKEIKCRERHDMSFLNPWIQWKSFRILFWRLSILASLSFEICFLCLKLLFWHFIGISFESETWRIVKRHKKNHFVLCSNIKEIYNQVIENLSLSKYQVLIEFLVSLYEWRQSLDFSFLLKRSTFSWRKLFFSWELKATWIKLTWRASRFFSVAWKFVWKKCDQRISSYCYYVLAVHFNV